MVGGVLVVNQTFNGAVQREEQTVRRNIRIGRHVDLIDR